jgi:tetratricopeptide (TPR) repeat protein
VADKALALVPENGRAHFCRARALLKLGRREEAIEELYLSLRFDQTQPLVHAVLAQQLMELNRFDESEELWKTMLEKAPGNFLGMYNLIKCQLTLGKRAEARKNFNKLEASNPNRKEVKELAKEFGK